MNAHYEKGRYFVPRRVPREETKGCQLMHYSVLIDSHNNLIYDFVWLCRDDDAVTEAPPVSQSDVP